jgi:hypothetical protein
LLARAWAPAGIAAAFRLPPAAPVAAFLVFGAAPCFAAVLPLAFFVACFLIIVFFGAPFLGAPALLFAPPPPPPFLPPAALFGMICSAFLFVTCRELVWTAIFYFQELLIFFLNIFQKG